MVEIFGKYYFIDLDAITEACKTGSKIKDDEGNETFEINIFKYELLKLCVERLLNEYDQEGDGIEAIIQNNISISFRFAYNTLLKNNIIIEDETDE